MQDVSELYPQAQEKQKNHGAFFQYTYGYTGFSKETFLKCLCFVALDYHFPACILVSALPSNANFWVHFSTLFLAANPFPSYVFALHWHRNQDSSFP